MSTLPGKKGERLGDGNREILEQGWNYRVGIEKHRKQQRNSDNGKLHYIPHVVLHGIEHKSCSRCARLKPLTEFWANHSHKDGLESACMECCKK